MWQTWLYFDQSEIIACCIPTTWLTVILYLLLVSFEKKSVLKLSIPEDQKRKMVVNEKLIDKTIWCSWRNKIHAEATNIPKTKWLGITHLIVSEKIGKKFSSRKIILLHYLITLHQLRIETTKELWLAGCWIS